MMIVDMIRLIVHAVKLLLLLARNVIIKMPVPWQLEKSAKHD